MTTATPAPANPCIFVLFGATGDLTQRLVFPALYNLGLQKLLPDSFAVVAITRDGTERPVMQKALREGLEKYAGQPLDHTLAQSLIDRVDVFQADVKDAESFTRLHDMLESVDQAQATCGNRIFYLAIPPAGFAPTVQALGAAGMAKPKDGSFVRVVVEKPFGTDLKSAQKLNADLLSVLDESQIYRIDHYLGKETVQNILMLRFANGLFEPIWNRMHIDHVQITVAETVAVERRGKFYEATGALRDMVPNHLFQLLSLVAMEPPQRLDAESVRAAKAAALDSIKIVSAKEALDTSVRAQYAAGEVEGKSVPAYRQEPDVAQDSATETFAALELTLESWRWAGVPFYLRTGKAMTHRRTEIAIKFKEPPIAIFRDRELDRLGSNYLVINIAPDEGATLQFNAKVPGPALNVGRVAMNFRYDDYFHASAANGYETLLYDCMNGDPMLFQRADGVEAGWRAVAPFLDAWKAAGADGLVTYPAGSDGPEAAHVLLNRSGRGWRKPQ